MRSFSLLCLVFLGLGALGCQPVVEQGKDAPAVVLPSGKPAAPRAGEWPNWLGPTHDGRSPETGLRTNWEEAPPVAIWRKPVGIGFSAFAVAQGRAITVGHADGRETIYCLNAATGEEMWSHSYECLLVDNLHEGGSGATPSIVEEFVYSVSRQGDLFCLKLENGDIVWQKRIDQLAETPLPDWGFTSSPLVVGDVLYIDAGRLLAFKRRTGELLWKTGKYPAGYGTPTIFEHQGRQLVAVLNNKGLLVVKAENGEEIAFHEWITNYATNSTTPLEHAGELFISSGYNRGCTLLKLTEDSLEPVYENRNLRNHFNNSVLHEGYLYGLDGDSDKSRRVKLVCMRWADGEVQWEQTGYGCGSLIFADGKLLVLSDDGRLALIEASPKAFRELGQVRVLDGRCWTPPVLAGGRVYVRNAAGEAVCLELAQ